MRVLTALLFSMLMVVFAPGLAVADEAAAVQAAAIEAGEVPAAAAEAAEVPAAAAEADAAPGTAIEADEVAQPATAEADAAPGTATDPAAAQTAAAPDAAAPELVPSEGEGVLLASAQASAEHADAPTVVSSGYCGLTHRFDPYEELDGKNITWTLYSDNSLVLEGTGEMGRFNDSDSWGGFSAAVPGWFNEREKITKIVVGEGITTIGSAAFARTAITSITLPSTIKEVDQIAFLGCTKLTSIKFNEGLESIGFRAFQESAFDTNPSLKIRIPKSVKTIDGGNFYDITIDQLQIDPSSPNLKVEDGILYSADKSILMATPPTLEGTFVVPASVKKIDMQAFEDREISGIVLPEGLETIEEFSIRNTRIEELAIPDSVTFIGRSAVQGSSLKTLKIGKGLKDLGANYAFNDCSYLETVEFSEGLETLNFGTFKDCRSVTTFNLPNSLRTIGEQAFAYCLTLTDVNFGPNVSTIDLHAFYGCRELKDIQLPAKLTKIGKEAFWDTALTRVVIPASVVEIGPKAFPEGCELVLPNTLVAMPDGSYLAQSQLVHLSYGVSYAQSEARGMLEMLNAFRSSDEAWYWDRNDATQVRASGLAPLTYDYDLEAAAMQRAGELAALFSHTRPDGSRAGSAVLQGDFSAYGENIAAGETTAAQALEAWKETNANYAGQGHRRNMLSADFNAVGIAHVKYGNLHFWVQEFGYTESPNTTAPAAKNGPGTVELFLRTEAIQSVESSSVRPSAIGLTGSGDAYVLPTASVQGISFDADGEGARLETAELILQWNLSNTQAAHVEGGRVVADAEEGSATLSSTVLGKVTKVGVSIGSPVWLRLAGGNALDTMREVVGVGFEKADTVILASNDGYWDALSASALAGKLKAPVLLTPSDYLGSQTLAEISRLGARKVIVCGGEFSVSNQVVHMLKNLGYGVERVSGDDARDTANAIAQRVGDTRSTTAIVASGDGYWDALSASSFAYATQAPIYLTDASGVLEAKTIAAMHRDGIERVIIAGGTFSVKGGTEATLKKEGFAYQRIAGKTAYDTSADFAKWAIGQGMSANRMGVATAGTFHDALTGGAVCGANNAVVILVDGGATQALSVATSNKADIATAYVFGGEYWIDAAAFAACEASTN